MAALQTLSLGDGRTVGYADYGPAGATPVLWCHGGPGWGSFDVGAVRCPVIVLHGTADSICPVAHAHHTAAVVPGARLELHDELGHFSIIGKTVGALQALRATQSA